MPGFGALGITMAAEVLVFSNFTIIDFAVISLQKTAKTARSGRSAKFGETDP